jgi:hypothetical protein
VRFAAAGLLVCLAALGISACGGGSGNSTSTSTSTSTVATSPPAAANGGHAADGGITPRATESGQGSDQATPQGGAGKKSGAAGFRRPGADNSIPDFGGEANAAVRAAATATLNGYLAARAGGRWSKACSYLGAAIGRQVAAFVKASQGQAPNCSVLLKTITEQSPEAAGPLRSPLAAFRVEGDKGFALLYGPHRQPYMIPMVREGDSWKVNQLDPVAYPPGSAPAR